MIQQLGNTMITLLMVKFIINDLPHASGLLVFGNPVSKFTINDIDDYVGFIPEGYPLPELMLPGEEEEYTYSDLVSGALDEMEDRLGRDNLQVIRANDVVNQVMRMALYVGSEVLVAWSTDNKVLGFSICCELVPSKAYGDKSSFYLAALVNTSSVSGVGKALIGEASRIAKSRGLGAVSVHSEDYVIPYYEGLGFIHSNPLNKHDMILSV